MLTIQEIWFVCNQMKALISNKRQATLQVKATDKLGVVYSLCQGHGHFNGISFGGVLVSVRWLVQRQHFPLPLFRLAVGLYSYYPYFHYFYPLYNQYDPYNSNYY